MYSNMGHTTTPSLIFIRYPPPLAWDEIDTSGLGLHRLTTNYFYGWVACLKLEIKLSQPQLKLKFS